MNTEERVQKVFAAVFQVPSDTVTASFSHDTLSQWDSLKHVTLVIALENEFGIRFEDDEYSQLDSFPAVVSILRAKSGDGNLP